VLRAAPGLRTWLLIVLAVVVVGTAGYVLLVGWPLGDAFYMTVITVTTTGFREVRELDAIGRVWTIMLSVAGVLVISGRWAGDRVPRYRGPQREAGSAIDEPIRGCVVRPLRPVRLRRVRLDRAGELVHDGLQFVVIDVNPASLERAREDGHLVVHGDATVDSTLRAAGITRARASLRPSIPTPRTST